MNIRRVPEMGLVIQEAGEPQLQSLRHIALHADAAGNPAAEKRLYPALFQQPDCSEHFEANRDWDEMVTSDLRRRFAADIEIVVADVQKAYPSTEDGWDVLIRFEHIPAWYSALNQARLVMAERYTFPDVRDIEALKAFIDSPDAAALETERFFTFLQSALLELELDRDEEEPEQTKRRR
jgi:uncharacterized protein YciU (UPF0263 family)